MDNKIYNVSVTYNTGVAIDITNVEDILIFKEKSTQEFLKSQASTLELEHSLIRKFITLENTPNITEEYIVFKLTNGEQMVATQNMISFKMTEATNKAN